MNKLIVPFKWAGSKVKERKKIESILNGQTDLRIVEPFMGTGIVSGLFGRYQGCFGNDLNPDITNLYRWFMDVNVKDQIEEACRLILTDENMNSHDIFYQVRERFNQEPQGTFNRAFMFFYLQNCAHFGLYRIGKGGNYTSTWHFLDKKANIDDRIGSLRHITNTFYHITKKDYKEFLKVSPYDVDLYFLDPPYIKSSYDDYSVDGAFNHDDLHFIDDYCTFLYKKHEICSIICNYQTENDDKIYKGSSEIRSFSSVRAMNLQNSKDRNYKTSIYVLYGDFSKTSMKDLL